MLWLISQFPELAHLETEERAKVLAGVPWWTYPLMIARSCVGAYFVSFLASIAFSLCGIARLEKLIACLIVFVLVIIAFYLNEINRMHNAMRNELIRRFQGKRPPFCLECGYDLRASDGQWCPECGREHG